MTDNNSIDYTKMTKDQLIKLMAKKDKTLAQAAKEIDKVKEAAGGRKLQVLKVLKEAGHITVQAISDRIGISARNVSSQLTYLRKDGYGIATDSLGRKFIEIEPEDEVVPEDEAEAPKTILRKADGDEPEETDESQSSDDTESE